MKQLLTSSDSSLMFYIELPRDLLNHPTDKHKVILDANIYVTCFLEQGENTVSTLDDSYNP